MIFNKRGEINNSFLIIAIIAIVAIVGISIYGSNNGITGEVIKCGYVKGVGFQCTGTSSYTSPDTSTDTSTATYGTTDDSTSTRTAIQQPALSYPQFINAKKKQMAFNEYKFKAEELLKSWAKFTTPNNEDGYNRYLRIIKSIPIISQLREDYHSGKQIYDTEDIQIIRANINDVSGTNGKMYSINKTIVFLTNEDLNKPLECQKLMFTKPPKTPGSFFVMGGNKGYWEDENPEEKMIFATITMDPDEGEAVLSSTKFIDTAAAKLSTTQTLTSPSTTERVAAPGSWALPKVIIVGVGVGIAIGIAGCSDDEPAPAAPRCGVGTSLTAGYTGQSCVYGTCPDDKRCGIKDPVFNEVEYVKEGSPIIIASGHTCGCF